MQTFEQLQPRKSRSREESVPSTFPEGYVRAHGDPGNDIDDFLESITEVLVAHERLHEEAHRQLGKLGIVAS
jgi:hypothetical protein